MRTGKNRFTYSLILVGLPLIFSLVGGSAISAQDESAYVRRVRAIDTDELGIANPAGLAFSSKAMTFLVVEARRPAQPPARVSDVILITPVEDRAGSVRIAAAIADSINMAFDGKANRLLLYQSATEKLIEIRAGPDGNLDPATLTGFDARQFGLQDPQGMTVDPASGHLFILDSAGPRLVRIEPDPEQGFDGAVISQVDLEQIGLVDLRGLAFDPTDGHLHLLSPAKQTLYELTETGQVVATRDLSEFELSDPQGMVFAPSGDQTDDPLQMSLYIADSGLDAWPRQAAGLAESGQSASVSTPASGFGIDLSPLMRRSAEGDGSDGEHRPGKIVELSISRPVELAMQVTIVEATLVQTIDTSQFSPPSPDPAGITYLAASNTLLFSDSEVEEVPIFTGVNLFEITLSGSLVDTLSTTSSSNEPTGVALNPNNGHLFFSDDNADEIFEMDPGADGLFDTPDDIITSFDTRAFGSFDPEDVAFDSWHGHLFIVDGENVEVYQIKPGFNDIFDGVPPAGDDLVTHFDIASLGVIDPEGIEFNSDNGHLYVVGLPKRTMAEITTEGTLVQMIDISAANALSPEGLTFAPGSTNATAMNIYIVDRGVDNDIDPDENDGKVYELSLPATTPPSHRRPSVDAGPNLIVILPDGAFLDGTVTDDGLPDPPGAVMTTWSQVIGPGTVTFAVASAVNTTASFSEAGTYVLRLTADDGELTSSDEVTIVVTYSVFLPFIFNDGD